MKPKFLRLRLLPVLLVAACASLTPSQTAVVNGLVKTGFDAGIGYLSGGTAGAITAGAPDAVAVLQTATLGLRSAENPASPAVPSADQITKLVAAVAGNQTVAKAIGPKTAQAITDAVAKSGIPPAVAIEKVATGLDKAAAASPMVIAASGNGATGS